MKNSSPFVLGLCALMLIVFAFCFWINFAR